MIKDDDIREYDGRRSGTIYRMCGKNGREQTANKRTTGSIARGGRNWTDDMGIDWFNSLYGYAFGRGAEGTIEKVWSGIQWKLIVEKSAYHVEEYGSPKQNQKTDNQRYALPCLLLIIL